MPILPKSYTRTLPPSSDKGRIVLLCTLALLLVCALLVSLRCGSQSFTLSQLWGAIVRQDPEDIVYRIFLHVRLPRTLACLLAGMALAVAGTLTQAVLSNPMASPNIIGVNAGAGFAALLVSVLLPGAASAIPAAAFLGALCTALFVYALALRAGLSRSTLLLAGVAISSMLTAGVNTITLLFPDVVLGATGFMLGGFSGVGMGELRASSLYIAIGLILALFLAVNLNVLELGEESATSLGLHVGRTRFLAILAAALLAGAAVSFAGLIGFVGLLVPHAARRLIGTDKVWLIPAAGLLGAAFVLLCDVLSRLLFAPYELPVGIVLSLLGGPFFLSMLLHQKRRRTYD